MGRDQVPAPLVQRLLARADGNPFFLEELAYTVLEHGADRAPWPMPETIQAVLTARIDRLPPTAKHVLHLAAVLGKDVPLALLEAMAALPPPTLQQGLQHLQRSADPHTEAAACFHQARAIARQQQAKLLELRATVSLGRLWHQQGQHDAARRMLTEVYGWFTEGFDTVDLQEAKTLLEELG